MASSRLTEDGRCVVTSPASWCAVGHELRVVASASTYGIAHADWVLRLVGPGSVNVSDAIYCRPAEDALLEALGNGSVHESLVAEPDGDGQRVATGSR